MDQEIESAAIGIALNDGSELDLMKREQSVHSCAEFVEKAAVFITRYYSGARRCRFVASQSLGSSPPLSPGHLPGHRTSVYRLHCRQHGLAREGSA
jgi:hypothetical protein